MNLSITRGAKCEMEQNNKKVFWTPYLIVKLNIFII